MKEISRIVVRISIDGIGDVSTTIIDPESFETIKNLREIQSKHKHEVQRRTKLLGLADEIFRRLSKGDRVFKLGKDLNITQNDLKYVINNTPDKLERLAAVMTTLDYCITDRGITRTLGMNSATYMDLKQYLKENK